MVGYRREEYVIKIEAPSGVSLDIEGDDDDYQVMGINGAIKMDIDDGDIELENCNSKDFVFDLDDGDVILRGVGGSLKLTVDDGDFRAYDGKFSDVDMRVDDGDIMLETTFKDSGSYTFRLEDGDLDLIVLGGGGRFDIRHDDGRTSYDRDFSLLEEDDDYTLLKLDGGNADIRVNSHDSSITLRNEK